MKRINFDLQQLQAFIAVADKGSFRAAAQNMHLSAPALGRRVGKLEEILGARLFTRSTRDVRLTRVGEAFVERARAALDDLEAAVLGINEISARHAGRVSVACVPSVASSFMPRAIQAFCKKMPHVRIRVIDEGMAEVAAAVVTGEADIAFGFPGTADAPLAFEPLWRDPYVLALRRDHPLARRRTVKIADVNKEAWLAVARTSRNRQVLDEHFSGRDQPPQPWLEVAHVATLLAMVDAGLGVGIVPALAVPPQHPTLVALRLSDLEATRQVGLLTLEGRRLTPVAQRFYELLRSMFKREEGSSAPARRARSKQSASTGRG